MRRAGNLPSTLGLTPALIDFKQSRNLAWAARSWVKELVRCSSSSSSCFLTEPSCGAERDARSTAEQV